jgi:hypothetical protein
MAFKIDDFTSTMRYGGARPHLFTVQISLPTVLGAPGAGAALPNELKVKATATQIPASTVDAIPVFYQGRAVNFSGNRTYAPWTIEVINDEDFKVYDSFVGWLSALNDPLFNNRNSGLKSQPSDYKAIATIYQYGQDETNIKKWDVNGVFPTNVSEISLGWQDVNQIERFQVTFAVDSVTPSATSRV